MNHEEYVEYSDYLVLSWGCILVGLIGWIAGLHGVVTSPPLSVETVPTQDAAVLLAETGWLLHMMVFVASSILLLESAKLRALVEQLPGAAKPGGDDA